jgi:hypothetical protein
MINYGNRSRKMLASLLDTRYQPQPATHPEDLMTVFL